MTRRKDIAMEIRKSRMNELDEIMTIYAGAREFMARTGNPRQWGPTCWPPRDLIISDIEKGKSYVCEDQGKIAAVFYFEAGKDIEPTYKNIEEGAWADESPYGVIHRIAAAEGTRGAGSFCIRWAMDRCGHMRMDTHGDNKVMQHVMEKLGFEYRGIIHVVEDNDPRFAYEYIKKANS